MKREGGRGSGEINKEEVYIFCRIRLINKIFVFRYIIIFFRLVNGVLFIFVFYVRFCYTIFNKYCLSKLINN